MNMMYRDPTRLTQEQVDALMEDPSAPTRGQLFGFGSAILLVVALPVAGLVAALL